MCLASASRKCFIHSLLTGRRERSADLLAAQLDANHALHLAQDQVVRDAAARLVVVHDLGLFADFRGQILLGEPLRLAALHDQLGHVVRHGPMLQLVRFPVQLGGVLRCRMLLVGAGIKFLAGLHRDSLAAGQIHGRFSLQGACLRGLLAEHGHGIPVAFGHFGGLLLSFSPNENLSDVARIPDFVHTQNLHWNQN